MTSPGKSQNVSMSCLLPDEQFFFRCSGRMFAMTHLSDSLTAFLEQLETYLPSNTVVLEKIPTLFNDTEPTLCQSEISFEFCTIFTQVRTHAHPPSLSSHILDYIDASSTLSARGVSSSPTQVICPLFASTEALCGFNWHPPLVICILHSALYILTLYILRTTATESNSPNSTHIACQSLPTPRRPHIDISCQFCTLLVAVSLESDKIGWGIFTLDQVLGLIEFGILCFMPASSEVDFFCKFDVIPVSRHNSQAGRWRPLTRVWAQFQQVWKNYFAQKIETINPTQQGGAEASRGMPVVDPCRRRLHLPKIEVNFASSPESHSFPFLHQKWAVGSWCWGGPRRLDWIPCFTHTVSHKVLKSWPSCLHKNVTFHLQCGGHWPCRAGERGGRASKCCSSQAQGDWSYFYHVDSVHWTASNLTSIGSRRGRGDANTGCLKSYWARLEGEI